MLAAERKVTSKLLEQDTSAEKLYIINEWGPLFLSTAWHWLPPALSANEHLC